MNKEQRLNLMKERANKMSESPKNIKCPGVLKALKREIRNMEK